MEFEILANKMYLIAICPDSIFIKKNVKFKCIFLLEVKYVAEVSSVGLCTEGTYRLLTLGLSPEVGSSFWFWIFTVLLRHCMGKCSDWMLLECG